MNDIVTLPAKLPAISSKALAALREVETELLARPQLSAKTQHVLHGGLYSRTLLLPKGVMITGALVKIPTLLILNGDMWVWLGERRARFIGFQVVPASAHRKQAFMGIAEESFITMVFPTKAKTVEECEWEFTDEANRLASHKDAALNDVVITGE